MLMTCEIQAHFTVGSFYTKLSTTAVGLGTIVLFLEKSLGKFSFVLINLKFFSLQVGGVKEAEGGTAVKYSSDVLFTTEKFEIV